MKFEANLHRCAILIDEELPTGLAINASSIIGIGLSHNVTNLVGKDLCSKDGIHYPGVIYSPLPILTASQQQIHDIFEKIKQDEDIYVMPFSALAQSCKSYDEYEEKLSAINSEEIPLVAIGVVGVKKKINKITGNLSLYR